MDAPLVDGEELEALGIGDESAGAGEGLVDFEPFAEDQGKIERSILDASIFPSGAFGPVRESGLGPPPFPRGCYNARKTVPVPVASTHPGPNAPAPPQFDRGTG